MLTVTELCHTDRCDRPGCSPEAGCQGHAWRDAAPEYYRAHLQHLVDEAAKHGFVLTVEQRPLMPPAMGHIETVVSVRPARVRS